MVSSTAPASTRSVRRRGRYGCRWRQGAYGRLAFVAAHALAKHRVFNQEAESHEAEGGSRGVVRWERCACWRRYEVSDMKLENGCSLSFLSRECNKVEAEELVSMGKVVRSEQDGHVLLRPAQNWPKLERGRKKKRGVNHNRSGKNSQGGEHLLRGLDIVDYLRGRLATRCNGT